MPINTYICKECGYKYDKLSPPNKIEEKIDCLNCGKKKSMIKQFPLVSKAVFKGNGFYETDYKKKGK